MSKEISHNAEQSRYEIRLDGQLAGFAEYRRRDDSLVFTHTEVEPAYEGQGVGSALVRGALEDVRAQGTTAVPLCPFVKDWIEKHPEYKDLVA
jgi:uncharacterized protein